jgi:amidase
MLHCLVPGSRPFPATGDGPLSGMRTAVKDCIELAGHTSSFGHARWRETHEPAGRDGDVVARLRSAGAEIVGVAKLDQLAYSIVGNAGEGEPPVNRYDPACFCGGSSSGSASAVAGGLVELGVGTDTGGSVRVPAAACGLYGLRTTHGRVSAEGVIPLARSLDVVGFLAASTEVIRRALEATAVAAGEPCTFRRVMHLGGYAAVSLADRLADSLGAAIEPRDAADLVAPEVGDLMARVQGREIWADHGPWIAEHRDALSDDVQMRLRRCEALSADPFEVIEADLAARERYRRTVRALVGDDGLLVAPVRPERGPRRDWGDERLRTFRTEAFRLTAPSSLSGLPQLVVTGESLEDPGLSLIGPPNSEEALLAVAQQLEEVRG